MTPRLPSRGQGPVETTEARSLSTPPPTPDVPLRVLAETHAVASFIRPHSHETETQILVPLSGVFRVETESALWIMSPGKAIVIPARTMHAVSAPVAATLCALRLEASVWSDWAARERAVTMSRLMLALVEAVSGFDLAPPPPSRQAQVVALLIDLLREAPTEGFNVPRPRDPRLRQIMEQLVRDPGNGMTLSEWGRQVGASERTLARLFEAEVGMGFRDCRRSIQIHSAVARLGGDDSLTEIAADLGYDSLSAFIHAFRNVTGETPGQMARRLRLGRAEASAG